MIENKKPLIGNSSFPAQARKAISIVEAGLKAADTRKVIEQVKLPSLKKFNKVYVIGFGKASAAMAKALEKRLGKRIVEGIVVSSKRAGTKRIKEFVGSHPIPSKASAKAAKKILSIAKKAGEKDLVICLISGGGSAMLAMPAKGISLAALQKTNQLMLKAKANIKEINCVRKHLSAVKGGLLMKAVWPASLYALVVSDVVGDRLSTIASGPTTGDGTSFKQATAILKKYGLWKKVPVSVRQRLSQGIKGKHAETPKQGDRIFKKAKSRILLNNRDALKAMEKRARELGFNAVVYGKPLQGDAGKAGKRLVGIAGKKLVALAGKRKRPVALIAGGETSCNVCGKGIGGRNQEMVLGSLKELAKSEKAVFASVDSDGIDGNSKVAGAMADSKTLEKAGKKKLNPKSFLKSSNSNRFFKKVRGEIVTGRTETNVMDLQLVLVWD